MHREKAGEYVPPHFQKSISRPGMRVQERIFGKREEIAWLDPISAKLFFAPEGLKKKRTSNIERPTSNVEWKKMKNQKN
jgi:hypothetical protein